MTFYYDEITDTVRRFENGAGERWDKKTRTWSKECCPERICSRWDAGVSEERANQIIANPVKP